MHDLHPAGRDLETRAAILDLADPRWTAFALSNREATPFHRPEWARAVADCYGFTSFALVEQSANGDIVSGLPVVEVNRPRTRRARVTKWVALPFTDHCPPLGRAGSSSWAALARTALVESDTEHLQIRAAVPGGAQTLSGVRHVLALTGDADSVYRGFHRSQVQRNIRRAEREGVTVRIADRPADLTETFYRLHLNTRRRQGVPVQPRRLFELIWREMIAPGHGLVLIAECDAQPVAAAVFLRHNATMIYKYGASDSAAWSLRPNHALFWHAIQLACAADDTVLDWGKTDLDNAGLRAFKTAWGAVEKPLIYTTIAATGASAPSERDLHASRAARMLATTIQHSPPWVCAAVGQALYRFTA